MKMGTTARRLTLAASLLAAATLLPAPQAGAGVSLSNPRIIGGPGHAFVYGWGAGTSPDGNTIYIGDYWNFEIKKFSTDGTYLGSIIRNTKGNQPGKHLSPYGITTDSSGNIYFGDVDSNRTVDKYTPDGTFITEWGGLGNGPGKYQYPSYLDIASDGRVFVVDSRDTTINGAVVVTTPDGQELFGFGRPGTSNGQFKTPRGISICHLCFEDPNTHVRSDLVYIVDNNNGRIQEFRYTPGVNSVTFVRKFGCVQDGINPDCYFAPGTNLRGIDIDETNGWVYIVDGAGDDIEKYDLQGNHLLTFGGTGSGPGQFADGGRDLTVDGLGHVWVGDMPNFRAQVFDSNGTFLFQVPLPGTPEAALQQPPLGGFNGPSDVAASSHGYLYVADTRNQRIQKINAATGTPVLEWGDRGKSAYGFNYPRAIAVDDSGINCPDPTDTCVYLADTDNGKIKKFTSDGKFQWGLGGGTTPAGSLKSWALDVGPDGRVYVANLREEDIAVLGPDGTSPDGTGILYRFGSAGLGDGQFKFPRGIAVDTDGSIWVSDSVRKDIQHFSNDGTFLGKIVPGGTVPDDVLAQAGDVAVDATYLYVSDTKLHKIRVWNKVSGAYVGSYSGGGSKLGRMFGPQGMDLLGNHLYVTEATGERITDWRVTSS